MAEIRLAQEADAAAIAGIYAPFCERSHVSFEMVAPTPAEMAGRIAKITARDPWLILEDGDVAGYVYAGPHSERAAYQWSVNVAVYIAERFRRRGVGRALYTALFRLLVLQGYFKAYAGATLPNPGSVGLHEALGFQQVGVYRGVGYKLGKWHDVAWFQKPLQFEQLDPPPPRALSAIQGTWGWREAVQSGLMQYRDV